jgi:hypothetical protein
MHSHTHGYQSYEYSHAFHLQLRVCWGQACMLLALRPAIAHMAVTFITCPAIIVPQR